MQRDGAGTDPDKGATQLDSHELDPFFEGDAFRVGTVAPQRRGSQSDTTSMVQLAVKHEHQPRNAEPAFRVQRLADELRSPEALFQLLPCLGGGLLLDQLNAGRPVRPALRCQTMPSGSFRRALTRGSIGKGVFRRSNRYSPATWKPSTWRSMR